ncbi:MAG: hypothetical protein C0406_00650 [Sideroxydans sp.]|nr:hypothetical protein [Sideroxydans sp.]
MFKLATSATYLHTVSAHLPGEGEPRELELIFKRLKNSEVEALEKRKLSDKEFAREVVTGWGANAVGDADGNAKAFSAEAFDELLDIAPVPSRIVLEFYSSLSGARLKNL